MTISSDNARGPLIVDALQYSKPERARFEEWRAGGIDCVHVTLAIWENARETLSVIGEWHRLFQDNGDLIALAPTVDDIERISRSGRTAVVFGFQNTSPFEDDIDLVGIFHKLGVCIVQLTYNIQNLVASGCWEDYDTGLSKHFGRNVIREMNVLGMLVDLSHCGERSSFDAIECSERPVAITHANPAEFVGSDIELKRRTKSTALIKKLAERNGVIGLSMYPRMSRGGSNSTLDTFCDMVAWTVDRVGVDAVGFGTDYYTGYPASVIKWWRAGRWARESPVPIKGGLPDWPAWFRSPADFPGVIAGLKERGFTEAEVAKIAGGNWLRLFRETFRPTG
ncbi:MAG: membrane dipeptidase [Pseudomonadota bacterium]